MDKNKPVHLLAVRLSAMGDVAMVLPVLKALLEQHPELRVTLLTRDAFAPLFASLERVTVFPADLKGKHKGIRGLWRLYRELSSLKPDGVADLHNVLRSNILKGFFTIDGMPFVQIDKGRAEKRALTAASNKTFKPLMSTHGRYVAVFAKLGFPVELQGLKLLPKEPLPDPVRDIIGNDPHKWIGIAPFAAFPGKKYPADLMEAVIGTLAETRKYRLLLFGGGQEEIALLQELEKKFPTTVNVAGRLSFAQELALISNLDVMVSMDSANAHLAANYNVPVVTLWGLTHPYAGFYPFGQDPANAVLADREQYPSLPTSVYGKTMPAGYEDVMRTISPGSVVAKVRQILEE